MEIQNCLLSGCINLKDVELPEVPELGFGTFEHCLSLEKIDLPKSITKVGILTFGSLYNLKEVNMPSVVEIGDSTFVYCNNLEKVSMGAIQEIGSEAFFGISTIKSIYLPANLKSINKKAFALCFNLGKIYSMSQTAPNADETSFNDISEDCTVYVPQGCAVSYKAAPGWNKLNIVETDMTGIVENVIGKEVKAIACYDLQGRKMTKVARGVNIIKMSNGTIRKVWKKK